MYIFDVYDSLLLRGLGKLGARWQYLNNRLKSGLTDRLVLTAPLGPHAVGSCILGLSKMGVSWSGLPAPAKQALLDSLPIVDSDHDDADADDDKEEDGDSGVTDGGPTSDSGAIDPVGVAGQQQASGLQPNHYKKHDRVKDRHQPRAGASAGAGARSGSTGDLSEQTVANLLWGLGTMEAEYTELNAEAKRRLQTAFTAVAPTFTSQVRRRCYGSTSSSYGSPCSHIRNSWLQYDGILLTAV
jgi:hypothetical protein